MPIKIQSDAVVFMAGELVDGSTLMPGRRGVADGSHTSSSYKVSLPPDAFASAKVLPSASVR